MDSPAQDLDIEVGLTPAAAATATEDKDALPASVTAGSGESSAVSVAAPGGSGSPLLTSLLQSPSKISACAVGSIYLTLLFDSCVSILQGKNPFVSIGRLVKFGCDFHCYITGKIDGGPCDTRP